ncbi:hypothetical protein BOW51_03795 [Solemya velesiana gill symbiont]|uniref:CheW-like domain-containing protein n=1 Tax=Solemya velesiana gill symbiont TaxID=1918948 RepID=A0A1T2KWE2_9GAMM|nr:hypothetical protein BOW51_03795 [Solemya velesiana gill symbiont]
MLLDLNLRFGHSPVPYRLADSVIVIAIDHGLLGIITSEVRDMVDVSPVVASLETMESEQHAIITEVESEGRIIMLLDHEHLIAPEEFELSLSSEPGEGTERMSFFPEADGEERRTLRERASMLRVQLKEGGVDQHDLVVVSMGNEYFGFNLEAVREFTDITDVVPVPCCPPHIMGNMNFRSDIVTLVDMRSEQHLAFSDASRPSKVVISEQDHLFVGIPVDDIHEVIFVESKAYRPIPTAIKGRNEDYVKDEIPYRDRLITVVDLENFLQRPKRWGWAIPCPSHNSKSGSLLNCSMASSTAGISLKERRPGT